MRIRIWAVAGVLLVLALAAVWHAGQKKEEGTLKIGAAVAQTDMAAQWGEGEYRTIKMLVDEKNAQGGIDGALIELVVEDTRSDANGTTNAILKLATVDQVPVIIGPTWGDVFQGGFPIAQSNTVVLVTPSTALESVLNRAELPYLFSTWWPQSAEVEAFRQYAVAQSIKRVAIINDQGSFSSAFATDVKAAVDRDPSLELVEHIELPVGSSDFRTTLLKVKAARPDVTYLLMEDDTQYGPLLKSASEMKLGLSFFSMTSAQNEALLENFRSEVEGLRYTYPKIDEDADEYRALVAKYQTLYGEAPSTASFSNTINAVRAVFAALEQGARTGPQIREALATLSIEGVGIPTVKFTPERQVEAAAFEVKEVRNGQFARMQ